MWNLCDDDRCCDDQVVPLSDIKNHKMTFKMGETLEEATIAEEFVARGYEKAPFVEAP